MLLAIYCRLEDGIAFLAILIIYTVMLVFGTRTWCVFEVVFLFPLFFKDDPLNEDGRKQFDCSLPLQVGIVNHVVFELRANTK